ncbi:DUF1207 domain-containing protein [Lacipirellula limnantheis]|uniref:DUF1207 domain-containing protein n=1 Tax=Lacipirellula limnantheis TaxID=2528024 RepID=A0A517U0D6_9BACT|nr:DUF1207 domain-containing protein [Lacipirellula limnantheis]QDT74063.1 hypothetical protein I41_32570 [Lacipirellula limnantheis]
MKLHLPLITAVAVWLGHAVPARCADAPPSAGAAPTAPTPATANDEEGWFDGWRPRFLSERLGRGRKPAAPPDSSVVLVAGQEQLPPLPPLGPVNERPAHDAPVTRQLNDPYLGGGLEAANQYIAPLPAYTDIPVPSDGGGYYSATSSLMSSEPYEWQILPQGLIYRSYLAGEKESRLRSFWYNERGRNLWDLTLGGNVGLLRYGTRGNVRPEGWQIGLEGAGIVRLDVDQNRDVDSDDFRGGIPMTWGDSIYQVKFAYYHLSSHLGDEYLLKHPGYPRLNYSRDCLVWGHSIYPTENFRVYGEVGYAVVYDVGKPWEFQFGVDWAPGGATGGRGAPFAAVNAHLREELNYGGNVVFQTGWAWRRSPASGLFRVGMEYYNGKDDQFSFYQDSVEKIGGGIWYDF